MKDLAILVLSCDRYSGLWDVFFERLTLYWPEIDCPIYLLANEKEFRNPTVTSILVGKDVDWSANLKKALSKITQGRVLLMMEDAFLNDSVNHQKFVEIYKIFVDKDMDFLNLKAAPAPNGKTEDGIGCLAPGTLYRVSVVPNLWKVNALQELLIYGETAWEFELKGSYRSDKNNRFYALKAPFFNVLHCVVKGYLDPRAASVLKQNNELQRVSFPVMSFSNFVFLVMQEFRSRLFQIIVPPKFRRRIRDWIL
jgi:hypothetical protein